MWVHCIRISQPTIVYAIRSALPCLYGIMLRAVASRGGGPGCRRHSESKRQWRESRHYKDTQLTIGNTYAWNQLAMEEVRGDNTYHWMKFSDGNAYGWKHGSVHHSDAQSFSRGCYQNRDIQGGTSRGHRPQAVLTMRHGRWKQKQLL